MFGVGSGLGGPLGGFEFLFHTTRSYSPGCAGGFINDAFGWLVSLHQAEPVTDIKYQALGFPAADANPCNLVRLGALEG